MPLPPPGIPHLPFDIPVILVIDNYDSFTYNLVHLVAREDEVVVIRNDEKTVEQIAAMAPDGILISPGPGRPEDAGISEDVLRTLGPTTPILGVCLGHQAIGHVYGATVTYAPTLMHGKTSDVHVGDDRPESLYDGLSNPFTATRYHSLVVDRASLPDDLVVTCETDDGVVMGLRHVAHPVEGVQFHPESVLTVEGPRLVANWVRRVRAFRETERVLRDLLAPAAPTP